MQLERTYTREQAIELLGCSDKARKNWIIQKLEEKYNTVEAIGRGRNIIFICRIDNNDLNIPEGAYSAFRNILIDNNGFNDNFNYDAILKLIEFHIYNTEPISNKDIALTIGVSERTIYNYRDKLKMNILKDVKDCEERTIGRNRITLIDEDITDFYNTDILPSFNSQLKSIHKAYFNDNNAEVAIFTNSSNGSFEFLRREEHSFSFIKDNMKKVGNDYIETYPVMVKNKANKRKYINKHLKQKIFELIINEFGYMFTYKLKVYEIHEDLKNDKELLNLIKLAIEHRNNLDKLQLQNNCLRNNKVA